ncbi:zinc-binding dehydrogenase [Pseudoclavibacter sp. RFBB5]|uniref:quinone oxidoreductase family protein n=1 Tax=Pseudoclavibacter sp. RFBB5 TaxID=2080574 RepID=UPI000CE7BDDA|nr:zinc-binding dehydrogenase [Pseudoclavibacter sp. RFBB5]PPG29063.1 Zn-dependent oxidoreductase [Pseudoclavibacter sp. RFBB5]
MRALTTTTTGHDHSLRLTERPVPNPQADEVTIDVEAAGIGLIDAFWASGYMPQQAGFVPGLEVAGTIRELGQSVAGFRVGQRVAALLTGAGGFADVVRATPALVTPIPDGLTTTHAAVVPVNTVTAHLALTKVARLEGGESVLVHAGAGGLGSQFAQIARELGASRVDAVVGSAAKRQVAGTLGYDNAHLRDEVSTIPDSTYDVVIDPVGGAATESAFRLLRSGGRLVRVGNASQADDVSLSGMDHWLQNKTTAGFNVGAWLGEHPDHGTQSLRWALEAVTRGAIHVDLSRTGSLDEHEALLAPLLRGETTGKLAFVLKG